MKKLSISIRATSYEAEMHARAEGRVLVGFSGDVELKRLIEHLCIAITREYDR